MQLDFNRRGSCGAPQPSEPSDRRRSLSVVFTHPAAGRHSGEVARRATGAAVRETSDARRTYARSRAPRWSAASLEDMLCVERLHVDPTGFVAARKPPYAQAAYWQALLASNWD